MKRKKWTEEEERTLLHAYSSFPQKPPPPAILPPVKRQKRFQPIADRVNSAYHLADPSSFPFLWSWRDIAVKIHNMRHQYLNVKRKILRLLSDAAPSSSTPGPDPHPAAASASDWDRAALDLWPNFLLYKQVFGDIPVKNHHLPSTTDEDHPDDDSDDDLHDVDLETSLMTRGFSKKRKISARSRWRERLRREERKEQEEMEWMERAVGMQMEHERQAMQMHADACQAQLQILGVLVRVVCQLLGTGSGGGYVGLTGQAVESSLHHQRQGVAEEEGETTESLVGHDNGNDDGNSAGGFL